MLTIQDRKLVLLKKALEDERIFEEKICDILLVLTTHNPSQGKASIIDYQKLQAEVNSIFRQVLCATELNLYYFVSDFAQELEVFGKNYYISSTVFSLLKILFNLKISIWAAENNISESMVKKIKITHRKNTRETLESIFEYDDFNLIIEELELDDKLSHLQSIGPQEKSEHSVINYNWGYLQCLE